MSTTNPDFANLGDLGSSDAFDFSALGGDASTDPQELELNKAIEELRGVLHDEEPVDSPKPATEPQPANASIIMDIPVDVQIVLGSTEMAVSELMALQKGSTVALNRRVGEAVDVVVNGRRIACGEITVLEHDPSRFGIKLTQIIETAKPG
ncbi:flagellar motor switch protein FliN [Aquamicrobium zhengzhouense]|uniref:Flagellar motor switch protein FliN n=1 Tax=Aquamicrobium zhengzhouense TaxID=2781738 RepID=A0ABS0SB80_9HYPH|nr:flagellar motor switch protein FliN [Aquamicrobium zhengzhouense]MBI1619757.1 flagellar motor switch protein FliN [Aquamicrobium zhengzhouense]